MVVLVESDEDLCVAGADNAGVAVGQVDAGVGQTDVVQYVHNLPRGKILMEVLLDLVAEASRLFDAKAGAAAHVKADEAGINRGEEILAKDEDPAERKDAECQKAGGEELAVLDRGFKQLVVAGAELVEAAFEAALKASHEGLGSIRTMLVSTHDVHDQSGDERAGKNVGGEHGEDDGFGQGHKKKLRHARQEKHGHEDDADANRGDEGGNGDLSGAVEDRLLHFLALSQIALDVFNFDSSVVHQDSDGEGETTQGHDVDGLPERAQHEDRDEDRKRNRDGDNDGRTPVSEEEQDHGRSQKSSRQGLDYDPSNRGPHKQGLIEEGGNLHLRRQRLSADLSCVLYAFDDRNGGRAADLEHRHERAANAVHANDVGLRGKAIANVGDVAHVNGRAIHSLNRKIVQLRDGAGIPVHLDLVFERPDLGGAGGQDQVLGVERIHDVVGRQAVGLKAGHVEVNLDLADLAAVGIWGGGSLHCGELSAQEIISQIEELLLRQCFAAQAKLDDGG